MDSLKKLNIKKMGACVLSTSLVASTAQTLFYYGSPLNSSYLSLGACVPTVGDSEERSDDINKPEDSTQKTLDLSEKDKAEYSTYFTFYTENVPENTLDSTSKSTSNITVAKVNGFSKKAIDEILKPDYKDVKLIFPNQVSFDILSYDVRAVGEHAFDCKMTQDDFINNIVNKPNSDLTADDYDNYIKACQKISTVYFNGFSKASVIDEFAFRGSNITSISLTQHIKTIGSYCFAECNNLTKIEIPNQLQTIMEYSFYKCTNLTDFDFENASTSSLKSIGNKAFAGCTSLTKFTIPPNVADIGNRVFEYSALKSLSLSDGIKTIPKEAFKGCLDLEIVKLPNTLEEISEGAFAGCEKIKNLSIPDTVKIIGDSAFGVYTDDNNVDHYCSSLQNVFFGESSKLQTIGRNAFEGCANLTTIQLYNTQITQISEGAFKNTCADRNNTEITFPKTLEKIGSNAFKNSKVSKITFADTSDKKLVIGEYAFSECDKLTKINFPSYMTEIDDYAFYKCKALETINFAPESQLTRIGDYAFSKDVNITEFTIPSSVRQLGQYLFSGGSEDTIPKLTKLTIENGLETIGKNSFAGCNKLIELSIPPSVKTIQSGAFAKCGFKIISIPSTVEVIENNAFQNCNSLNYAIINRDNKYCNADYPYAFPDKTKEVFASLQSNENRLRYEVEYDIENDILTVAVAGFDKKYLTGDGDSTKIPDKLSVTVDDSVMDVAVTKIKSGAFKDCTPLQSIKTPRYLDSIEPYAFANCTNLQIVNLTKSTKLSKIEENAFNGCTNLKSVVFAHGESNDLEKIGNYAFFNCPKLSECNINDCKNLKIIGDYAFSEPVGTNSTTQNTKQQKQLHTTVSSTLFNKDQPSNNPNAKEMNADNISLYSLYGLDKLETIGKHAFHSCNLYHVYIPKNVTTIGERAFQDDFGSIYNLYFYGQNKDKNENDGAPLVIGDYAFIYCENLKKINIPSRVTEVKTGAFSDAINCTTLVLNEGLKKIGSQAFAGMVLYDHGTSNYSNITVPSTVKEIYSKAFANIKNLDTLSVEPTIYQGVNAADACIIAQDAFTGVGEGVIKFAKCVTPDFDFSFLDEDNGQHVDYATITDFRNIPTNGIINTSNVPSKITLNIGGIKKEYIVRKLGNNLFKNNKALYSVSLPETITQIGDSVFENCTSLYTINLPKTITKIGNKAFANTGINKIEIYMPELTDFRTKNFFGTRVFQDCGNLTDVYFNFKYGDTLFAKEEATKLNYAFASGTSGTLNQAKLHLPTVFFSDSSESSNNIIYEIAKLLHIHNENIVLTQEDKNNIQDNQSSFSYRETNSFVTDKGTSNTGSNTASNIAQTNANFNEVTVIQNNITKIGGIFLDNEGILSANEAGSDFGGAQLYSSITSSSLLTDAKFSSIKNNEKVDIPLTKMFSGLGDKSVAFLCEFSSVPSEDPSITLSNCIGKTAYIMFVSMDGKVVTADGKTLSLEEVKNLNDSEFEKLAAQKIENIQSNQFTFKVPHAMYIAVIIK